MTNRGSFLFLYTLYILFISSFLKTDLILSIYHSAFLDISTHIDGGGDGDSNDGDRNRVDADGVDNCHQKTTVWRNILGNNSLKKNHNNNDINNSNDNNTNVDNKSDHKDVRVTGYGNSCF